MDGRWKCETEGLVARTRPDGRTEWVEIQPPCADGHGPCRHWTCGQCGREERTPLHVCDPDAKSREVDQRRR